MQMTMTNNEQRTVNSEQYIKKKRVKKIFKIAITGVLSMLITLRFSPSVFAADLKDSNVVKGTEKLIGDITSWLMILAPVVTVMLVIYFAIRRSAADEMDQKKWNNRIMVAVVSCIGAVLASALVNLIIGYYQ
jgi:nitric oxide reductase large subunit